MSKDIVTMPSVTTRKPREGEVNEVDYYFLSTEEFEKWISEDNFLEYATYNNNYYVIYHVPKTEQVDEYYKALCMSITINSNTDIPRVTLPFPMYLSLTPNIVNSHNEKSEKYVDYFFERFTFEDACEFYERYTNGVAEIEYDNKLIYVDAREKNSERTYHEKYLCIDFVNRRFICDKDGENEVVFE